MMDKVLSHKILYIERDVHCTEFVWKNFFHYVIAFVLTVVFVSSCILYTYSNGILIIHAVG